MIYGTMILESNFNNLLDPIETFHEYYENEISLLNTSIAAINETNNIALYNDTTKTKNEFVKNIIEKLKEILKKFIEWCKKIVNSVKNLVYKDSDTLKKNLKKDIEEIKKCETMLELKVYGRRVGLIIKDSNWDDGVFVFDVEKYITDLNNSFKKELSLLEDTNKLIMNDVDELSKDNKLSENNLSKLKDTTSSVKNIISKSTLKNIKKDNYFKGTKALNKDQSVEYIKNVLIKTAQDTINSIDYIDKEISNATNNITTLENRASELSDNISMLKNDDNIDKESINAISSAINATVSAGKNMCQIRIKKLNSVKNIYRVGGNNAATAKLFSDMF